MTSPTTLPNSTLSQVLDGLAAAATGLGPVLPGMGGTIAGIVSAGLRIGAAVARSSADPVATMVRMESALPAFLEFERRSHGVASEYVGHQPGDGE